MDQEWSRVFYLFFKMIWKILVAYDLKKKTSLFIGAVPAIKFFVYIFENSLLRLQIKKKRSMFLFLFKKNMFVLFIGM